MMQGTRNTIITCISLTVYTFTKRLPGIGHLTYREKLSALNFESLEIRRLRRDLLLAYRILFGMADIDSHKLFCLRANIKPTRGHVLS